MMIKTKQIRTIIFLKFLFVLTISFAQGSRTKTSINSSWMHVCSDASFEELKQSALPWKQVHIPHTYNQLDPFDDVPSYFRGKAWYKKDLYLHPKDLEKSLYLYFEGVNQVATVYLNNKKIGTHKGAYTSFCFDITKYVQIQDSVATKNELIIEVDNSHNEKIPPLGGDFNHYGGIYRDVYLIKTNNIHFSLSDFASTGVYITTPEVSEEKATVKIKTLIKGNAKNEKVILVSSLHDATGKIVNETKQELTINDQNIQTEAMLQVEEPNLWSVESPYLYTLQSRILNNEGEEIDFVSNTIGFRWYKFTPEKGFFLNGKHVKLIGANRHQDMKGLANALPDYVHYADVLRLKEMGGNILRVAHYPQDPVVLEACDKLGLVVTIEIPIVNEINESEDFAKNSLMMMEEMVKQNFNHPSIVIWTYMNEVLLFPPFKDDAERHKEYLENTRKLAQRINDKTKELDPDRYTMIVSEGNFNNYFELGMCDIPDIVGWNLYEGWYGNDLDGFDDFLDMHHKKLPNKPVIVTEFGAGADNRLNTNVPERYDFSIDYAVVYHKHYLNTIFEKDFVAGGTVWNLTDFGAEHRGDGIPHVNNKGLFTYDRKPKEPYYIYENRLKNEPLVRIGSKSWVNRSSVSDSLNPNIASQVVRIHSNMQQVELLLNDVSLGVKTLENNMSEFVVPFTNGENVLLAKAKNDTAEVFDLARIDFTVLPFYTAKNTFDYLNVNAGSSLFFNEPYTNKTWIPDKKYSKGSWGYVSGSTFTHKTWSGTKKALGKNIPGTDNDHIYRTQRINPEMYLFDVLPGEYEVELHFAELLSKEKMKSLIYELGGDVENATATKRVFSIVINNNETITDLNLAKAFGERTPFVQKHRLTVNQEKQIKIEFQADAGAAIINGISIRRIN